MGHQFPRAVVAAAVVLAGCGGSGGDGDPPPVLDHLLLGFLYRRCDTNGGALTRREGGRKSLRQANRVSLNLHLIQDQIGHPLRKDIDIEKRRVVPFVCLKDFLIGIGEHNDHVPSGHEVVGQVEGAVLTGICSASID